MTQELWYVTTAILRPRAAHALQVLAMARAFDSLLGNAFRLVSPAIKENIETEFCWQRVDCYFYMRVLRYPEMVTRILVNHWPWRNRNIFTRDIVAAMMLSMAGANVVYEMHHEFRTGVGERVFRLIKNRIKFVTISNALKDYLINKYFVAASRILVAHDAVDTEKYRQLKDISKSNLRKELDLPEDKTLIVYTGSLSQHVEGGGMDIVQDMMESYPELVFVSVGGNDSEIKQIQKRMKGVDNIIFITQVPQDHVIKYQFAADLLFFPQTKQQSAWWCTSPLKLFEYMATGIPVLGAAIGSAVEIINESNALTYNPDNVDSVLQAINQFLSDRNAAQDRADRASALMFSEFGWDKRARFILEFFR